MSDEKYEFEQAEEDRERAIGGIATGLVAALGLGINYIKKQKKSEERQQLLIQKQALVQELNEYNSKLLSFLYEDEKNQCRKKIKEIDEKLNKL